MKDNPDLSGIFENAFSKLLWHYRKHMDPSGCYFAFGRSIIFAGQKKYPSDNGEKVYDMYTVMGIYSFISDRNS